MLIVIRASSLRGGLSQFPVLCRQLVAGSCRLARSPERVSAVPAVQNHHSVKFPRIGVECVGGGCMAAILLGRSQWTPHHPNTHTHRRLLTVCAFPIGAAGFSYPPVPCWLFIFYAKRLWGDKFNSQFCQTCVFFPDLLFPLCSVGTMPRSVPSLDPSFAWAGAETQTFARLFCLESLTSVDGKREKKEKEKIILTIKEFGSPTDSPSQVGVNAAVGKGRKLRSGSSTHPSPLYLSHPPSVPRHSEKQLRPCQEHSWPPEHQRSGCRVWGLAPRAPTRRLPATLTQHLLCDRFPQGAWGNCSQSPPAPTVGLAPPKVFSGLWPQGAIKRVLMRWMNLELIIQSEVRKRKTNIVY